MKTSKKKFFMVLPLITLPFITFAFWALGGGQSAEVKAHSGLNINLPDANIIEDKDADKLSFYRMADKDADQHKEVLQSDLAFKSQTDTSILQLLPQQEGYNKMEVEEAKMYSRINELNRQINKPATTKQSQGVDIGNTTSDMSGQVDRLQQMMRSMTTTETDSETIRLNGMMDRILDIQHPERVNQKIKEKSAGNKQQVFAVEHTVDNRIGLLQSRPRKEKNTFYDDVNNARDTIIPAIDAVVEGSQTIMSGSTVKLRLATDVYINDVLIGEGSFIYGIAAIEGERLMITITSVRNKKVLLPVSLQVYDLDGLPGIHIPGSTVRDVTKESTEKNLQAIDLGLPDQSIAARVTGAGIQTAKSLLTRKVKTIKVSLKAGYAVLLKDKNQNN